MELEQLKCPGCGAPISIKNGEKIVVCEYCSNSFTVDDIQDEKKKIHLQMERDKAKAYKERLDMENQQYEKVIKGSKKASAANMIPAFIVGVVLIILIGAAARVFLDISDSYNSSYTTSDQSKKEPVIINKIDDIPKVKIDKINYDSIKSAKNRYIALYSGWSVEDYSVVGDYLISYDNEPSNFIISVIKCTYKNNKEGTEQVTYAAFCTNNLCLKEDGTTVQSSPNLSNQPYCKNINPTYLIEDGKVLRTMIFGWEEQKELYKDCIAYNEKKYHISYAGDLYIPNNAKEIAEKAKYVPSTGDIDDAEENSETTAEETAAVSG